MMKKIWGGMMILGLVMSVNMVSAKWWGLGDDDERGNGQGQSNDVQGGLGSGRDVMNGNRTGSGWGALMSSGSGSYVRNALRAANYKGFSDGLLERKQFMDQARIHNQEAVQFLQQRGILNGYADGTFGPENAISRAESLKVIMEALGIDVSGANCQAFDDVDESEWYCQYVGAAKNKGFVKGYADGTFQPNQTVVQAELLKIAFETFGIDLSDYEVTGLPEGADETQWYAPYLQYALDNGLLNESDLDLADGMTRDDFAELIYRLIQQQEELAEIES